MSVTIRPARSMAGDDVGERNEPPGKMYFAIQGLVGPGLSVRPIVCRSMTPSSSRRSAAVLK